MWSRKKATVRNTLTDLTKASKLSLELGLEPQGIIMGPCPVGDDVGFQTAIEMLQASQKPGKNDKAYVQFDTI